uniref:Uncharacterized protein n=1 Tax=Setaria italica TaxID=4555 RepID=K3Z1U4_SETIT
MRPEYFEACMLTELIRKNWSLLVPCWSLGQK